MQMFLLFSLLFFILIPLDPLWNGSGKDLRNNKPIKYGLSVFFPGETLSTLANDHYLKC